MLAAHSGKQGHGERAKAAIESSFGLLERQRLTPLNLMHRRRHAHRIIMKKAFKTAADGRTTLVFVIARVLRGCSA